MSDCSACSPFTKFCTKVPLLIWKIYIVKQKRWKSISWGCENWDKIYKGAKKKQIWKGRRASKHTWAKANCNPCLVVEGDSEGPHSESHTVNEGLSVVALTVPLVHQIVGQLACNQDQFGKRRKSVTEEMNHLKYCRCSQINFCAAPASQTHNIKTHSIKINQNQNKNSHSPAL